MKRLFDSFLAIFVLVGIWLAFNIIVIWSGWSYGLLVILSDFGLMTLDVAKEHSVLIKTSVISMYLIYAWLGVKAIDSVDYSPSATMFRLRVTTLIVLIIGVALWTAPYFYLLETRGSY